MSDITQAIETVQDMMDVLETAGSCYVYKHNGGADRLRNVLECLRAQQELAKDTNVRPNPPLTLGELRQMDDEILSRGSSSYCRTCGIRRNCVIGPCARCDTKKVPPSEWVKYENPELTLYPQEAHHGSN